MRNIIYVWRGICVILSWLFPYLATCEALCTIVANGTDVILPMLLPSCPRSNTWMVPFSVLAYRIFRDLSIHSWTRGSENRITKLGTSFYCNFSCFYSHFTVLVSQCRKGLSALKHLPNYTSNMPIQSQVTLFVLNLK